MFQFCFRQGHKILRSRCHLELKEMQHSSMLKTDVLCPCLRWGLLDYNIHFISHKEIYSPMYKVFLTYIFHIFSPMEPFIRLDVMLTFYGGMESVNYHQKCSIMKEEYLLYVGGGVKLLICSYGVKIKSNSATIIYFPITIPFYGWSTWRRSRCDKLNIW